jgi:hypothetical protein
VEAMKSAPMRDRYGLCALGVYLALSMLFFGRGLVGHFTDSLVGKNLGDPGAHIWFLTWLPHALANGRNPIFTDAIWAPAGMNLGWTTWIPLEALISWPITATLGPVASYNFLSLISLPLAAWSAFVLCRYVSDSWPASLVGGYVFGFSGYMISYLWIGDLSLIAVFPIPLAVYAVVRAINRELGVRALVGWLTILLIVQFAIFTELFATATMFGLIAIGLAMVLCAGQIRDQLRVVLLPIVISYLLALLILLPYLYYIFSMPIPKVIWPVALYAADLYFFLLPSPASALGQIEFLRRFLTRVPHSVFVGYSYLGPVMLAVVAAFAWQHWREPRYRFPIVMFLVVAVLSFGPRLTVGGRALLPMPGLALYGLPLMRNALAARFTMYLGLIAALIMAQWLSTSTASVYTRCAAATLATLFLLPGLSHSYWNTRVDTPDFFASGAYSQYLKSGEITLVVPYGWSGNSMLWQAQSDMYFRMAGAWSGMPPAEFQRWPAMIALFNGAYLPDTQTQLKAFMAAHQVRAVLVDESARSSSDARQRQDYFTVLGALGPALAVVGGVGLYTFTRADLRAWEDLNPLDLERRVDEARFAALVDAVDRYVQSGAAPALLSPARLERQEFIRKDWVGGPNILIGEGLWAKGHNDGTFDIGTFGSRAALAAFDPRYRPNALRIRVRPVVTAGNTGDQQELELMVMTFDRGGLARAALLARAASNSISAPASIHGAGGSSSAAR